MFSFYTMAKITILCIGLVDRAESQSGEWRQADLTTYESYPTSSSECQDYSGCKYKGTFAFVDGQQTEEWVEQHHIISINQKDADQFKRKTFLIQQGDKSIQAQVLDECNDDDCNGCCSSNSQNTGFLIDMEKYTYNQFGGSAGGTVQWQCIDC